MKKRLLAMVCGCLFCGGIFAQHTWFNDKDLTLTGAYYYPEHWDESQWERDLKQMHELGFEFTHFAEFAWAQLEPQEGVYDFSWLDRAVALAAKYDLKVVMCTSTATPPVWLSRKYPEILLKSEDGTVQDHGARQHASFASPVYRKLAYRMIEELARVALQRCTTARDAIQLMGKLVKEYGYGDSGECLTIADPKEVWHFEIFGEGPDQIGGVWAAVRIPDDEVGVSANISRISTLNLKDTRNYMASENVFSVAKKLKLWDGKEPFKFWKAYGGPNYFGKMQAFSIREFFILSTLAPSLKLSMDDEELPLSVKPEKKISNADVMAYLRQTYEGTEWSVTKNLKVAVKDRKTGKTDTITSPRANPWMRTDEVQLFNALQKDAVTANRNVAVPQCAYSTVIQLRDWLPDAVGGVCWFGMDNPGQSPRVPIFCGTTDLPEMFKICGNHRYRLDAALWHYRQANKLATVRWGNARKILEKNLLHFERKGLEELPMVEQRYAELVKSQGEEAAKAYLTDYTKDFIGATLLRWDEMTAKYWNDYRFGF